MSKLLIAGGSYSTPECFWHHGWDTQCIGMLGFSNRDIWYSLAGLDGPAVIALTSLHCLPKSVQYTGSSNMARNVVYQHGNQNLKQLNEQYARRIIDTWSSKAVIWSTLPDYEHWPDVLWFNFGRHDNLWASLYNTPDDDSFSCHLDQEGHQLLRAKIREQLERRNLWRFKE